MNFKQQSGKTITEAFAKFHKENPKVYQLFKEYFFFLHKRKGWQRVGAKLIMERIRFEYLIITSDPNFKINNNFTTHYARLFVKEHPEYKKCFVFRKVKELEQA